MAALDLLCPCRKIGQAVATWGTDGACDRRPPYAASSFTEVGPVRPRMMALLRLRTGASHRYVE